MNAVAFLFGMAVGGACAATIVAALARRPDLPWCDWCGEHHEPDTRPATRWWFHPQTGRLARIPDSDEMDAALRRILDDGNDR